jgi:Tol biopolymer transport system component
MLRTKPFSWAKPAILDFSSSSNFNVQDHMLSTTGDALGAGLFTVYHMEQNRQHQQATNRKNNIVVWHSWMPAAATILYDSWSSGSGELSSLSIQNLNSWSFEDTLLYGGREFAPASTLVVVTWLPYFPRKKTFVGFRVLLLSPNDQI